jgi:hypothetical protein
LDGEIQGKCSNLQWAVTNSSNLIGTNCLVTCGDADSMFDPYYFPAVSAKYVELGEASESTIFQPTIMHLLNIFEQSHLVRATSIFTTIVFAGTLEDRFLTTLPYSTFTISAGFMNRFGGWDSDYLNDDWHTGTKAFVAEPVNSQIVHMPFPVVNCAVDSETWFGSWVARWKQAKRHALGVEELVYMLQMLPVCHGKLRHDSCSQLFVMYARFCRIFLFVASVHIRFAFIIPANIAMTAIMIGAWFDRTDHFPFYGQAAATFLHQGAFRWNACLTVTLIIVVLGKSIIAVKMVQHLIGVGRIPGELAWWAQSPIVQYIHNFISMALSLPVVGLFGSLAEVLAVFKVAGWDKQSFEFYVAPKEKGVVQDAPRMPELDIRVRGAGA